MIIADKTDVRRNRVRTKEMASFDIHDRVNYAVKEARLKINTEKNCINLNLQIDENICTMYEYFDIFLGRMMMCRQAAEILGLRFKLTANARQAVRLLESYRNKGNLLLGVALQGGGTLRIEKNYVNVALPDDLPEDKADNRILKVCKGLVEEKSAEGQIVLVSKDLVLRLKAQILGMKAEDYTTEQITEDDAGYTGRCEVFVPDGLLKDFKKKGIDVGVVFRTDGEGRTVKAELTENEFVILKSDQSLKKTLLGRVENGRILPLVYKKCRPYGVTPRNVGQYFMQEALNFIRGRSIAKTYLIIDEAQNMTPNQVKGIITRAGKGTKIILLGDPNQIDKPFLDEKTNGLSYAAKYMKGSPYCYQITLSAEECERSELAMDAVKRL